MFTTNIANEILKEILDKLSLIMQKSKGDFEFCLNIEEKTKLKEKLSEIDYKKEKTISYDTNELCIYFIKKFSGFFRQRIFLYFNSYYQILYFKRIINYMKLLIDANINIIEDDIVKVFFILLILFIEDNLEGGKTKKVIDLDESFFLGTYIELNEKYGLKLPYKDSDEITNYIIYVKNIMNEFILYLIEQTFQDIINILKENGKKDDEIIQKMISKANDILYEKATLKDEISENLINQISDFYSKEENLIFANYISEVEDISIEKNIDKEFLNKIKQEYLHSEFNYNFKNNISSNEKHLENLDNFINQRNKHYNKMKYTFCKEIIKFNLNKENNIFVLVKFIASNNLLGIKNLQKQIENLNTDKIKNLIKEILNENDFYDKYFSILKCDIIKKFFTSHITTDEKNDEFHLQKEKSKDSENFSDIYFNFIQKYDKKEDNYNEFKKLIILKILTNGDRAYTLKIFKKIIINPSQFYIGEDIKEEINIKAILKGYLMVILLHETEHFFRAFDNSKNYFPKTPREKEGGRMFIKYIFDVQSINHINFEQANKIFCEDIWKSHEEVKKIFSGQLEDVDEENIGDFLLNYFKNSISFYSSRQKIGKQKKYVNNDFLWK